MEPIDYFNNFDFIKFRLFNLETVFYLLDSTLFIQTVASMVRVF